jgi:hypothetical protein
MAYPKRLKLCYIWSATCLLATKNSNLIIQDRNKLKEKILKYKSCLTFEYNNGKK